MIKGLILGYVGMADEGRTEADKRLAASPTDGGGLSLAIGLAVSDGDDEAAQGCLRPPRGRLPRVRRCLGHPWGGPLPAGR